MIEVAIIEDDEEYRVQLADYLEKYQQDYHENLNISQFTSGDDFLQTSKGQYDLFLLDIQMPLVDGFEVAREIRKNDNQAVIIFVTNAAQYAIRGYEVGAFDYILKPIRYFPFSQSIRKACGKINKNEKAAVIFRVKSGMARVAADDILYIESQRHTICVHTVDTDIQAYGTLKKYEEQLKGSNFSRGSSGYLINLKYVKAVKDKAVIVNDKELFLSRGKRDDFMKELLGYWEEH